MNEHCLILLLITIRNQLELVHNELQAYAVYLFALQQILCTHQNYFWCDFKGKICQHKTLYFTKNSLLFTDYCHSLWIKYVYTPVCYSIKLIPQKITPIKGLVLKCKKSRTMPQGKALYPNLKHSSIVPAWIEPCTL